MQQKNFDLIIIGAGPAGLSAAVYSSRYKVNFLVIGMEMGGRANETHKVENFLGFPSVNGFELGQKFIEHAKALGSQIVQSLVKEIKKNEQGFEVVTDKETFQAKNILLSLGSEYRRLSIPGENEFKGKGISYCATCDGPFFKNKKVAVVGGGNSAASAALLLSEYAEKVTIFYRGEELKCFPAYLDQLVRNDKITIACCTNLKEIKGDIVVKSIAIDKPLDGKTEVETDGVFIEIGSEPSTDLIIPLGIKLNERHFIMTNPDQSTNVTGVYAAGDLTTNSNGFRQIITAAAEGAIAALSIYERIKAQKSN